MNIVEAPSDSLEKLKSKSQPHKPKISKKHTSKNVSVTSLKLEKKHNSAESLTEEALLNQGSDECLQNSTPRLSKSKGSENIKVDNYPLTGKNS